MTTIIMLGRDQARELAARLSTELGCYSGGEWTEEVLLHHHHHHRNFMLDSGNGGIDL